MDKQKYISVGIDVEDAIRRFSGAEAIYEKYLLRFPNEVYYQNAMKALAEKNYDVLLEQVHAMKGMVGNLGMRKLFDACQIVVDAIRAKDFEKAEEKMQDITSQYELIMQAFQ